MRKYKTLIALAVVVSALMFSLGSWGAGQASGDGDTDDQLFQPALITLPEIDRAPEMDFAPMANGTTDVYSFVGQDFDTNTTVIFLTNTSGETVVVGLYKYYLEGNALRSASAGIELNPGIMVPVCSDEVVSTVGIWNFAIHWDFGPNFVYGNIILPPGVVVDGYVAWNSSDNKYDPGSHDDHIGTVPIKFTYVGSIGE